MLFEILYNKAGMLFVSAYIWLLFSFGLYSYCYKKLPTFDIILC